MKIESHDNLDFFSSGNIPPNPAELLLHKRVNELFSKIQVEYNYVIIEIAPINLVTDTLALSDRADCLFLLRKKIM